MYVILFRLFKIGLGVFLSPCYLTFFLIRLSRTLAFSVLVGCLPPFLASIVNVSHKEAERVDDGTERQREELVTMPSDPLKGDPRSDNGTMHALAPILINTALAIGSAV